MLNSFAPPFSIIATYFSCAIIYLLSFCGLLFGGFSLASLHAFFAGFALNIIIAALLQLASVIYERAFVAASSLRAQALILNAALAALIYGMHTAEWATAGIAGGVIIICLIYFCVLFFISFFCFKNFAQICLFAGVCCLVCALVAAAALLAMFNEYLNLVYYDYALSFHAAFMLGFVFLISLGAASVLLPMFLLSHKCSQAPAKIAASLFACTLIALAFSERAAGFLAALALICALVYFAMAIFARSRKKLDFYNIGLVICLIFGALCAAALIFARCELALKIAIFGLLFCFIAVHAFKIWPFLIWYHFISPFAGRAKVPVLSDLISAKIAYLSLAASVCACIAAVCAERFLAYASLVFALCLLGNLASAARFIKYKGDS